MARKGLRKYQPYIVPAAVLSVCVFYTAVYFGFQYRKNYIAGQARVLEMQKAEQARIEEERLREQLRDQELSDLRMQLEELKNRPPETETVTEVVKVENPDKVADIVKVPKDDLSEPSQ